MIAAVVCIALLGAQVLDFNSWPTDRMSRPADRAAISALPAVPKVRQKVAIRPPARRATTATRRPQRSASQAPAPRRNTPRFRSGSGPSRPGAAAIPSPGGTQPVPASRPQPAPVPVPVPVPKPLPVPVPVRDIAQTTAGTGRSTGAELGGQVGKVSPAAGQVVTGATDQAAGTVESVAGRLP
jgi:hypothetical protein